MPACHVCFVEISHKSLAPVRSRVLRVGPNLNDRRKHALPVCFEFEVIGHDVYHIVAPVRARKFAIWLSPPPALPELAGQWPAIVDHAAFAEALLLATGVRSFVEFANGDEAAAKLAIAAGALIHLFRPEF